MGKKRGQGVDEKKREANNVRKKVEKRQNREGSRRVAIWVGKGGQ